MTRVQQSVHIREMAELPTETSSACSTAFSKSGSLTLSSRIPGADSSSSRRSLTALLTSTKRGNFLALTNLFWPSVATNCRSRRPPLAKPVERAFENHKKTQSISSFRHFLGLFQTHLCFGDLDRSHGLDGIDEQFLDGARFSPLRGHRGIVPPHDGAVDAISFGRKT